MKKFFAAIISIIVLNSLLIFCVPVYAESDIVVRVNGVFQKYDQGAVIINNRTMVPLRGIFEKLGAAVEWDAETRTITATSGEKIIKLTIDSTESTVNGSKVTLDSPAVIISDRTLVPLRFVSEALGCPVEWDDVRREARVYTVSQEVLDTLKKYDTLFDRKMLDWMISLYDTESGGFYYSRSSLRPYYFASHIESTAQMFEFMTETRLLPKELGVVDISVMPEELRTKFINFFQTRQSEDDGYFYDPQYGKDVTDGKRERDFTKTSYALGWLGAKPLYKTPTERAAEEIAKKAEKAAPSESSLPEQYQSEEKFKAWLDTLPWETYAYSAGNSVASSITMIRQVGYQKIVQDYVTKLQNQNTGFWGGDQLNYDTLNAAMKISGVYDKEYPFPNLEKALESTIYVAKNCEAPTASSIWNVLMLINTAKNTYADANANVMKLIDDNFIEITDIILETLKKFRQDDGGYSYLPSGSSITSQGSVVSLGLPEGDINGTLLCASKMREQAYWLYKITVPPLLDTEREYFFNGLLNAKPIEKDEFNPVVCDYTFDDMKLDETPETFKVSSKTESGKVFVSEDPVNFKNKALQITGDKTGYVTVSVPFGTSPNYTKMTFEQRVMVSDPGTPAARWYVSVGGVAFQWLIDCYNQTGNRAKLTIRSSESGMGDEVGYIQIGEWYNLKIEYIPNGLKETKIRFYLDGVLINESGTYFNGGDKTKMPAKIINGMTIGKFSDSGGTLLLDNIKVSVE